MAAIDPAEERNDEAPRLPRQELEAELGEDFLAEMRASTQARIEKADKNPLQKVRSLRTGTRRILMLAVLALLGGVSLVKGTGTISVFVFLVLSAFSFWLALRPIHDAPLPSWVGWGLASASLATAIVVALFAPTGGMPIAAHSIHCFIPGMGLSIVLLGILRILKRRPLGFVPFASSVGAGLAANAFLAGRCPITPTTAHLLMGHGSVLVALIALAAAAGALSAHRSG